MIYRILYRISLLLRKRCPVCQGRRELAVQVVFNESKVAYIGCERCQFKGWIYLWE